MAFGKRKTILKKLWSCSPLKPSDSNFIYHHNWAQRFKLIEKWFNREKGNKNLILEEALQTKIYLFCQNGMTQRLRVSQPRSQQVTDSIPSEGTASLPAGSPIPSGGHAETAVNDVSLPWRFLSIPLLSSHPKNLRGGKVITKMSLKSF